MLGQGWAADAHTAREARDAAGPPAGTGLERRLNTAVCAFMPCFMLRSMFLHAYMFRSTCLGFYAMFAWFCFSLYFVLMIRVMCSHA